MAGRLPLAVRIHARLVRSLVPSLGQEYITQANTAFGDLYGDMTNASIWQRIRLLSRECVAIVVTAFAEYKEQHAAPKSVVGSTPDPRSPTPDSRSTSRRQHPLRAFGDNLRQDFTYAIRSLLRTPGFTAVVIASLALGMSITTTFFSIVNALVLRPPPHVEAPDELMTIRVGSRGGPHSYPDFVDIRNQAEALENAALFSQRDIVLTLPDRPPRRAFAEEVSESYFNVLGVAPVYGRSFIEEEWTTANVTVLGYGFWQREFGGAPEVLGQVILIDGREHTVVGVAPPGLTGVIEPSVPDLWYPVEPGYREMRGRRSYTMIGRMRPGASIEQTQAQLDLIAARLADEYPGMWKDRNGVGQPLTARSIAEDRIVSKTEGHSGEAIAVLAILSTIVLLVLGIACSNVANLLLTRAQRRRTEIAMRLALGASRRRLIAQLLNESLILAGVSGAAALFVVYWITDLVASGRLGIGLPAMVDVTVDWRVALFVAVVATGTGILFGLVPALQASRPDLVSALKGLEGEKRGAFFSVRNILVVVQVAGSLILLVGATLFMRSLQEAGRADLGFDPENVAVISLDLGQRQYTAEAGAQFYTDVVQRMATLPNVESVALAMTIPLGRGRTRWGRLSVEGYERAPNEVIAADGNVVTPGYFDLVRMSLVRGRDFTSGDRDGAVEVVVINEAFVDRYFGDRNPLGKQVDSWEVVGVVRNAKYDQLGESPLPHIWLPHAQNPRLAMGIHVRTGGDVGATLAALVRQVQSMDPGLPIMNPGTMEDLTAAATLPQRIMSVILGVAGLIALGMAMMGIYGVMAFAVSQRTREVGLRIALGAHPVNVVRMIVREGLLLSGTGLVVGLAVSAVITRALSVLLYGVSPMDPGAMFGGASLLLLASVAATLRPALSAARVDPMQSLRN
ncbi:MAG: ABC transporter permease [Gemmatimonadetes bacterium]|nr:ABC transporter permease [Gemmatimonadota bacterium]